MSTESFDQQTVIPRIEERNRKEREVLYLRHKLQRGLLNPVYPPNDEEMGQMSEFISKLENYPDLESTIIRFTKINKVLKCILKLPIIPRDSEFRIRSRSKALLEIWNKSLEFNTQPHSLLDPVQQSFERISLFSPKVIDDWVVVICAGEDNVVMEENI